MGVTGSGKTAAAILRQRPHEHPYAIPPFAGAQGLWLIRQGDSAPLGYLRKRPVLGGYAFDVYAHCRDDAGGRPWLHTAETFNSAVAWAVQHDREIHELIARSTPEPEAWPPA